MASSAAQDEYNTLFAEKSSTSRHPEDEAEERRRCSTSPEPTAEGKQTSSRALRDGADFTDEDSPAKKDNMRSRYFLPNNQYDANTGPKGVIADAQAFERAKKDANKLSAVTRRLSKFVTAAPSMPALHPYNNNNDDDDRDKSSEDDEEGFMARWRQKRLVELQSKTEKVSRRNASPSQRQYGSLTPVDAEGYLDAIERVQSTTVVLVYIYDDTSEVSTSIEHCVRKLARVHTTTRFVKLHYEEAEMEVAGVPAILAYKGGEKFAGIVPVTEEIPDDADLSPETIETLLKKHQILS